MNAVRDIKVKLENGEFTMVKAKNTTKIITIFYIVCEKYGLDPKLYCTYVKTSVNGNLNGLTLSDLECNYFRIGKL